MKNTAQRTANIGNQPIGKLSWLAQAESRAKRSARYFTQRRAAKDQTQGANIPRRLARGYETGEQRTTKPR